MSARLAHRRDRDRVDPVRRFAAGRADLDGVVPAVPPLPTLPTAAPTPPR
ncbi:hypothetical protein [Dactylosporangium sp. NPDC049140]